VSRPNRFLALPVDATGWFPEALGEVPYALRLLHPRDLHLTLAFLGPVTEAEAVRAWEAACSTAPGVMSLQPGALEAMGPPHRWSALAAAADTEDGRVAAWAREHRGEVQRRAGATVESRPPRPHVTLGRLHGRGREAREEVLAWAEAVDLTELRWTVDRLVLMTRVDEPQAGAPRFRILRDQPLD
jgi:2'-5' RNA ligase